MDDLKECPFCGGETYITGVTDFRITSPRTGHRAACSNCHAYGGAFATRAEAIESWNRRAVPQANAEQDAPETVQWSYSTDEENYKEQEDSREAIIQVALSEIGEQSGVFWIAKNKRHTGSGTYVAGSVIEGLQEQSWEECGEFAETFLDDVTKEEEKELADLITDWCARVDRSNFWTVFDVELLHIEDLIAASNAASASHPTAISATGGSDD